MDYLSRIIQTQIIQRNMKGIKVAKNYPEVSHLFFPDDILLFLEGLLHQFSCASVQVVNLHKSTIFFSKNVSPSVRIRLSNILQMKTMRLGEKYLCIPLLMHMSRTENCKPILDHMNDKIQGCNSKIINQAGKTT